MVLVPYTKPHATAAQRITHLRAKGLIIPRPSIAERKIELIGYERLRIYFLSRRQLNVPGRPFNPNTSYMDILRLYDCDMRLRDACFAAVGHFELLLRNAMSEALSHAHGSHPYFTADAFKDSISHIEALKSFAEVSQKTKDRRAKHYREIYGHPAFPPIWTMKELMTFGATSRILQRLSGPIRTKIAADFGVPKDNIFTYWVECLVDLRNHCAHHDRLFNRKFQKQPNKLTVTAPVPYAVPSAASYSLKAILECLDHMLNMRGLKSNVTSKVNSIISSYSEIIPAEAGY